MRAIVRKTTVDSRSRELPYALFVTVLYKCTNGRHAPSRVFCLSEHHVSPHRTKIADDWSEYANHMFLTLQNYVELLWEGIVGRDGSREERKRKKTGWTSTADAFPFSISQLRSFHNHNKDNQSYHSNYQSDQDHRRYIPRIAHSGCGSLSHGLSGFERDQIYEGRCDLA